MCSAADMGLWPSCNHPYHPDADRTRSDTVGGVSCHLAEGGNGQSTDITQESSRPDIVLGRDGIDYTSFPTGIEHVIHTVSMCQTCQMAVMRYHVIRQASKQTFQAREVSFFHEICTFVVDQCGCIDRSLTDIRKSMR